MYPHNAHSCVHAHPLRGNESFEFCAWSGIGLRVEAASACSERWVRERDGVGWLIIREHQREREW